MSAIDPDVLAEAQQQLMRAIVRDDRAAAAQIVDRLREADPAGVETTLWFARAFSAEIVDLLNLSRPGVVLAVADETPNPDAARDQAVAAATATVAAWAAGDLAAVDDLIGLQLQIPDPQAAGKLLGALTAMYRSAYQQHQAATS